MSKLTGMLVAVVLLAGCVNKNDDSPVFAPVVAGKLTACTDIPYAPFELLNGGQYEGIDVDIIKAIAKDMKLEASFKDVDFDSIFGALDRGECDLVASSVSITPERQQRYRFSDGYFEINQSLLVRNEDASTYRSLQALSGHIIGVQNDTTGSAYATANKAKIKAFDSADEIFAALEAKEVDGVVQDFPVNSYYAQQHGTAKVVATFNDVNREQYGFAMMQNNYALQAKVNKALAKIRTDGQYDQILYQYLGSADAR